MSARRDAGGLWRPHGHLAWPARVRSRDGVRRFGAPLVWNLRLDELREECE
jgi:hypothetical protein